MPKRERQRKTNRPYRPWEPDLPRLRRLARAGLSERAIAAKLDRHHGSVARKCRELGITLGGRSAA
jgi:hypothetical protein